MKQNSIILAGGCFWGVEELFQKLNGVIDTQVGYTGGHTENPHYATVKTGTTGHAEAIKVDFDPNTITYKELLHFFFSIHDPTTINQQGNDRGSQYRSAIFYGNEQEKLWAQESIEEIKQQNFWKKEIVTEVVSLTQFYDAEEDHQDYLKNNPGGYTCHFKRY